MQLRSWRERQGYSLQYMSELMEARRSEFPRFDLCGPSKRPAYSAANINRWELGRAKPDAPDIEYIAWFTDGQVTVRDLHNTRLQYLQSQDMDRAA